MHGLIALVAPESLGLLQRCSSGSRSTPQMMRQRLVMHMALAALEHQAAQLIRTRARPGEALMTSLGPVYLLLGDWSSTKAVCQSSCLKLNTRPSAKCRAVMA